MIAFFVWTVAAASMVIDHAGVMFFPGEPGFRMVGRLAWPLFALMAGRGALLSSRPWRLAGRYAAFAVASVPPHLWAFGLTGMINIFATLALGVGLIAAARDARAGWEVKALGISLAAVVAPVEYGVAGVVQVAAWAAFWTVGRLPLSRGPWQNFRWWFYPAHLAVLAALKMALNQPSA